MLSVEGGLKVQVKYRTRISKTEQEQINNSTANELVSLKNKNVIFFYSDVSQTLALCVSCERRAECTSSL